jgi:hypothetical protein
MKTKYVMNGGLAFSEKRDIKKLEKLATEGWLFQEFAFAGFYYKLVKGPSQQLTYTMDFQANPDADYFNIFRNAGWHHVTSWSKQVHIFSAPQGTAPIYTGNEIDEGKYTDITATLGKGSIYTLAAVILCAVLLKVSQSQFEFMHFPLLVMTMLSVVAFIFCFMPYVAYKFKERRNQLLS